MKSNDTKKHFPKTEADWQALIDAAPNSSIPSTITEEMEIESRMVVVHKSGHKAVSKALAAKYFHIMKNRK